MGTPDFSVPALTALVEAGHDVIAVVTQPDKPKGRGKLVQMTPVKEKALEYGIPVYQPVKARDPEFVSLLKEMKPDAMVVAAFGQLLPKTILDIPPYGCVNIHASLLPKYRGAAPIQFAVINGESAVRTVQDEEKMTYFGMLKKSMGDIDWNQDAASIERLIRGLNPWPSAYTSWEEKTIKLWEADALEEEYEGACGQVVKTGKDCLYVKTGKGTLAVKELQLQGKKRMDTGAFLRGYQIAEGTVFERSV